VRRICRVAAKGHRYKYKADKGQCARAGTVCTVGRVFSDSGDRLKHVCERSPLNDDLLVNVKERNATGAMGASGQRDMALWATSSEGAARSEAMVVANHSR
jgi:hypothetical protein